MANTPEKTDKHQHKEPVKALKQPAKRDFLTKSLAGFTTALMGFILYPLGKFLKQPPSAGGNIKRTLAATVDELPNNTGKIFRFGNEPGLVIRTESGEIKAFSAVCTHLDCTVQYVPDKSYIFCACHEGKYDLNGQVISGPPPRPLEEYQVDVQDTDIMVTRA